MKKVNLGPGIVNYPMPVALAGAVVDGKVNFLAVAWLSMVSYNPPKIAITLGNQHHTNKGIKEHQAFSLCFPSEKDIVISDYCGIVSGEKVDKSELFQIFYGDSDAAPMIEEFLLNVECKVDKIIENGANETFIADIIGIYADEEVLIDGKVSMDKLNPVVLSQTDVQYRKIGDNIGQAWKIGKDFRK